MAASPSAPAPGCPAASRGARPSRWPCEGTSWDAPLEPKSFLICLFPGQLPPAEATAAAKQPRPPGICRYVLGKLRATSCRQLSSLGAGALAPGRARVRGPGAPLGARVLPQPPAALPSTGMMLVWLWADQNRGPEAAPHGWNRGDRSPTAGRVGGCWCPWGHQALASPLTEGCGAELAPSCPGLGLCRPVPSLLPHADTQTAPFYLRPASSGPGASS